MKRKIYDKLKSWKEERKGRTAILLTGARRVGKSYIVNEFAKNEYRSYILIDFNNTTREIKALFENYLNDLDTFFMYLSTLTGTTLYNRDSLIIFDEVEMFPKARAAIKYLVADGRYDYIETGSLVSIKKNVENIVIPSEEEEMNMFPMDFEEFLWAMGNNLIMNTARKFFEERRPMALLHRQAMDYFRQYLIVGGMPQVVYEYVSNHDFNEADRIKRGILKLYRNDIQKYGGGSENKVVQIFDSIPSQLQRHEKKFRIGDLQKGARMRDYDSAFFWLQDSMVCNFAYNTTAPNIGLGLNADRTTLKCYFGDTGLLMSMAFDENEIADENIYKKMLTDKLEFNDGMLVENIVAQMLRTAGHKLYFFSSYDKENSDNTMEIDFLTSKGSVTSRHNIIPIEVKSSQRYTLSSLRKCVKKYSRYLAEPIVLHTSDLTEKDGILYLPLYMAPFI
jgi:predicted AAA+ superfamily ATPase